MTRRAIENGFPTALVSKIAEHESWRKEVYRPLSYIHKWWAKRLGSVFRFILIASCVDESQDIERLFWDRMRFPEKVIFDPFMGSGIIAQEAVKLGCRVISRDINAVAYNMVHAALQQYSLKEIKATFTQISKAVQPDITALYRPKLDSSMPIDVLYYFWVKQIPCPLCALTIDLFKSRIFAKHAYPQKYPDAKASCPGCGEVNTVNYDDIETCCHRCNLSYNPQLGSVNNSVVTCPHCHSRFTLINAVRRFDKPLQHRMYAKMVLYPDKNKEILPIDNYDKELYQRAEQLLPELFSEIPQVEIQPGYNTNQILNYNYHYWHELFNARQLVCLALLAREIKKIPTPELRQLFTCLFTGILEFNNMFASFKGIGTGAVRHMFAHHILKPELMPLEAHPWGTDKSSGSFSTLFESRILRALEYKNNPFELRLSTQNGKVTSEKAYNLSKPINPTIAHTFEEFIEKGDIYLSVGDSSNTDIPSKMVDLVITDPPFFDNVHYSELADFFYVWLRQIDPKNDLLAAPTTRSLREVQSGDFAIFTQRLADVFSETHRVLKDDGLLIFTYHHSRSEGWIALYQALTKAGFLVTKTHPVKAEMAVSISVQQSKTPVNFDLIIVCRKRLPVISQAKLTELTIADYISETKQQLYGLYNGGVKVSTGDVKMILMGIALTHISQIESIEYGNAAFVALEKDADTLSAQCLEDLKSENRNTN